MCILYAVESLKLVGFSCLLPFRLGYSVSRMASMLILYVLIVVIAIEALSTLLKQQA